MATANGSTGKGVRIGLAVLFAGGGLLMTATRAMHWDEPGGNQLRLAALTPIPQEDSFEMPGVELCGDASATVAPTPAAPAAGAPVGGQTANGPSTRPSDPRGPGFGDRTRFPGGWSFPRIPSPTKSPTTQPEPSQADVAKFMEEHSPHKWNAFKAIPDQFREGAIRGITAKYKEFKRLEAEDQRGYELELKQAHLEDQVFEAAVRFRAAKDNTQKQETIRKETREKVRELSAVFQEKRQHQLDLVQAQITSLQNELKGLQSASEWLMSDLEKSKLASADDVEKRIDRRTEDYLNPHRSWRGGRGSGGPGGPGFDRGSTTRPSRDGGPGGPGRFGPPPGPPPPSSPE